MYLGSAAVGYVVGFEGCEEMLNRGRIRGHVGVEAEKETREERSTDG